MATALRLSSCAAMAATVASFTGLTTNRNRAYADGAFRFNPFSFPSSSSSSVPPSSTTPQPENETPEPNIPDGRFEAEDLERMAKAVRTINTSKYIKQVRELMNTQEKTRLTELSTEKAQYETYQAEQDIERQRKAAEDQVNLVTQRTQLKAQQAREEDEFARKRIQIDHETKRKQNAEMVRQQEEGYLRKAQARRDAEEKMEAQKRITEEKQAAIHRETSKAVAKAKAEARAHQAKLTEEQDRRLLEETLKAKKEELLMVINRTFHHVGEGIWVLLTDRNKQIMAVGGVTALAAGVYTTREGARVTWRYINRMLGQPSLIRESSIAKYPLVGTVSRGYKKALNYFGAGRTESKTSLENIILHPSLHKRIQHLARATENTKAHDAPFRNMLFYGPPGTGKTMVAREIARESGLDYAMMTGGDVAPLGADAVTKIHQIFDWSKRSKKGLLLFIDEADAFLCERNSIYMSEAQRSALNALLYRTGDQSRDIVLVLATNRPGDLDSAITDRIDEVIEFPIPGEEERIKLLKLYLEKSLSIKDNTESRWRLFKRKQEQHKIEVDLSEDAIREAARKTEGFSGREIAKLIASVQASVYAQSDCVLDSQLFMEIVDFKVEEHNKRKKIAAEGAAF
ncbi:hypothetical protein AQUCO_00700233v1 [Aquilegia coerulea]|uniref:AAA+ ATPase domain-containing protein n=1 Tax=Aquilegia coerulea TaxID=218851 RepID=A0A2G5EJK0_AQUCA|nr:hypothetical protein AQUCO_00700233v1 [Aquilegia coerulea]